ncbi:MAG: helix-turn-helix transcriptional regulator [Hydrogenophilaceae bacterium]|jgi:transcriptional regulator with XRE-family HTH domain|nr:helix-turn-helix transcriptional regulator [Hydrogenophilaceae bacterium]
MKGRALVAWNLRRLRTAQRVSQERLAADAGVDRAYISEIEREEGNATVDLLDRLADVLDVPLAEFFAQPPPGSKRAATLPKGRRPAK